MPRGSADGRASKATFTQAAYVGPRWRCAAWSVGGDQGGDVVDGRDGQQRRHRPPTLTTVLRAAARHHVADREAEHPRGDGSRLERVLPGSRLGGRGRGADAVGGTARRVRG